MNATTAILIWSVLYVSLGANLYLWSERPEWTDLKERAARRRLLEVALGACVAIPFSLLVIAIHAYRSLRAALDAAPTAQPGYTCRNCGSSTAMQFIRCDDSECPTPLAALDAGEEG